jgi:hypothetical protein
VRDIDRLGNSVRDCVGESTREREREREGGSGGNGVWKMNEGKPANGNGYACG